MHTQLPALVLSTVPTTVLGLIGSEIEYGTLQFIIRILIADILGAYSKMYIKLDPTYSTVIIVLARISKSQNMRDTESLHRVW